MSVGSEVLVADDWLQSVLGSIAGINGGAWADHAPQPIKYPFLVYTLISSVDVNGMGPNSRIMVTTMYSIKTTSEGTWDSMKAIMNTVDTSLQGATATLADGHILSCQRHEQFRMVEVHDGRQVRHLGGAYEINVIGV